MGLPDVKETIGGKAVTLSLPIGGLEEIAEVNPYPEELWNAFRVRQYSVKELKAVIAAGLKWGGSDLDAEDVINGMGLRKASGLAERLLAAAVRDDDPEKKASAVPDPTSDNDSRSGRT